MPDIKDYFKDKEIEIMEQIPVSYTQILKLIMANRIEIVRLKERLDKIDKGLNKEIIKCPLS